METEVEVTNLLIIPGSDVESDYIILNRYNGVKAISRLTKEELPDFTQGIPFEDPSQTFEDAVHPTRTLGIRYLWINFLCIIQDET